jgi:hypothetical protein
MNWMKIMLKRLICFLWGHDLDKDKSNLITRTGIEIDTGKKLTIGVSSRCLRCGKFKEIAHI